MMLSSVLCRLPLTRLNVSGTVNSVKALPPHLTLSIHAGNFAPKICTRKFAETGVIMGSVATYFFASIQNQKEDLNKCFYLVRRLLQKFHGCCNLT